MAQISKGTTYADGMLVTSSNLNAHVDNATLTGGAISDQALAASVTTSDLMLLNQGSGVGTLKKASIAQILGTQSLSGYVKADGSVAMTGNLTLPGTAPTATQAVSRAWVEGYVAAGNLGYTPVNKAGDTMSGNLTMSGSSTVVLSRNPSANLEAATKQYVDAADATFATQVSLSAHTGNTSNPHSVTAVQVGLGNVNNTSDLNKPVSTAQQAAIDLKLNLSGGTLTGALGLPAGDPPASNSATSKSYVDASDALKVAKAGDAMSGTLSLQSGGFATTMPSGPFAIVNKSYVDKLPRVAARGYFSTSVAPSINSSISYPTVSVSRTAGSSTLTVNYASLGSQYNDPAKPFFLTNQYVGFVGITGLAGKLYKIQSNDTATSTFTVTTTETTALSGSAAQLSLVYSNFSNVTDSGGTSNVKSIYVDLSCYSKYYVNFIADIIVSLSFPISVSQVVTSPTIITNGVVSGNACAGSPSTNAGFALMAVLCFDTGRTTYINDQDHPEGYGATSMGFHLGYYYNYNDGLAVTGVYGANFSFTY